MVLMIHVKLLPPPEFQPSCPPIIHEFVSQLPKLGRISLCASLSLLSADQKGYSQILVIGCDTAKAERLVANLSQLIWCTAKYKAPVRQRTLAIQDQDN